MNNFTGFGYQAFGFCPRGHLIFIRFLIYSWKRQWKFDSTVKHHLLVLNRQRRNYNFFLFNCSFFGAVSWLKHRLDSRNHTTGYRLFSYNRHPPSRVFWTVEGYIFIFSLFLNCPTNAMMFIYFFKLESSHALFLQHVRRPFNHKPESHHRMSHNINCCLCSNSYIENLKLLSAIYHVEALISKQTLQFHLAPTALEYI